MYNNASCLTVKPLPFNRCFVVDWEGLHVLEKIPFPALLAFVPRGHPYMTTRDLMFGAGRGLLDNTGAILLSFISKVWQDNDRVAVVCG